MLAWCEYCQKNTLSVAVKNNQPFCGGCGQKHAAQFSKIRISLQQEATVSAPAGDQRPAPEPIELETAKYLTPELRASLEFGDSNSNEKRENVPISASEREKKVIQEIDHLEQVVQNLVHSSRKGVPKPKGLKPGRRPKKTNNAPAATKKITPAPAQSAPTKQESFDPSFGAGGNLGNIHLRVDMGHTKSVEMGQPADNTASQVPQENQVVSSGPTTIQSLQSDLLKRLPQRSTGIRLSSLSIALSWCVQLLLGFSYFSVMPMVFRWMWIAAQTIGTVSLGYIVASQIWDNDRNEPADQVNQPPKRPSYSKGKRSKQSDKNFA